MQKKLEVAIAILFICYSCSQCAAVEAMFLPGDACFCSIVSDEILKMPRNEFRLKIGRRKLIGYMDGYCGKDSVLIVDDKEESLLSFQNAYSFVRRRDPRRVEFTKEEDGSESSYELNEVFVFIHNAEFRWQRFSPFMRYNENWVRDANEYNKLQLWARSAPRIRGFIPDMFHYEWRDAELVPPLKHRNRPTAEHPEGIECHAEDIMIFLISSEDVDRLTECALGKCRDVSSVRMFCVERAGISELSFDGTRWKLEEKEKEEDESPEIEK